MLHTILVKHYNDLLESQTSERGKNEVSYFYVGDVFCIYLGFLYADFQEKFPLKSLRKGSKLFIIVTLLETFS